MSIFNQGKSFYRSMLAIAVPVALTNLLQNSVGLMDTFMVSTLGDEAVSAIAGANKFFFIFTLILFGIASGASVMAAQYWGKQDVKAIEKIVGIVLRYSLIVGAVFGLAAFVLAKPVMLVFSNDPEVIRLGVGYLRIIALTFVADSFSVALCLFLRSIEKTGIGLISQIIACVLNFALNSIFIFGLVGAPKMGVNGAALGTLISRCVCLAVVVIYLKYFNKSIKLRPRYIIHADRALSRDFFKYAGIVVINETLWGVGFSMHAAIFGHISTTAMTAASVVLTIQNMITIISFGSANAAGVLVGMEVGKGDFKRAKERSQLFLIFSVGLGLICTLFQMLARAYFVDFAVAKGMFNLEPQTVVLIKDMLLVMSIIVPIQAMNCHIIVGILRSGGDTKYATFCDVFFMWMLVLPAACICAFLLHWNPIYIFMVLYSEEILKCIASAIRMLGWKWMKNVTREAA
ncbi:MAG: MATE family efflux transporter [Oscillospiraceae bacterium]|jgi:putative MATE family efflux protein|nr:MATE family efflux transporter [Oscillospiraceae bacterium]